MAWFSRGLAHDRNRIQFAGLPSFTAILRLPDDGAVLETKSAITENNISEGFRD